MTIRERLQFVMLFALIGALVPVHEAFAIGSIPELVVRSILGTIGVYGLLISLRNLWRLIAGD